MTRALLNPFQQESWAVGVRKYNDELRGQVNAFLKNYRANGGFDRLGDKWLKEQKDAFAKMGIPFFFVVDDAASVAVHRSGLHWQWRRVAAYWRLFASGWKTTIGISLAALGLSTLIGFVIALARRSRFLPLRWFAKVYVELIRGTPLLAQIYVFVYIIADTAHLEDRYVQGVITLSIFSGAYIAEIIRAGIEGVGKSQVESAMAIGLTSSQTYRHVIFPQALRAVLPPLAGQFVSLIKDSSLLSIVGLNELTQNARNVASYTYSNVESYLLLAAGYLVLTLPISLWTRSLEKRFRYET